MDGDPKNGTDDNDGGANKTDPIPGLGGKTRTDVKIQNGQVSLDTMDADLAAAVKSGDEAHVRARLGGDQKLTEAQALILIKTREEEERIAYQQAHPQGAETVDVHRKEGDESIFPWAHPNRDWEHDIQTSRFQGQGGGAYTTGAVQPDGFIYERDGSRVDATWGFRESRNGVITTRGGDVYDTNKNTYRMADGKTGQFLSDETLKHTRAAGMSDKDAVVNGTRNSEALAAIGGVIGATVGNVAHDVASNTTSGSPDIPQTKKDEARIEASNKITAIEADHHTTGKTQEALATGKPVPKETKRVVATYLSDIGLDPATISAVLNGATGGVAAGMAVAVNTASPKPVTTPAGQTVVSSKHVKTPADKKTSAQVRNITTSTIAASAAALDNVKADGTVTVEIPSNIMGVIAQTSSTTKFGSTDITAVAAEIIDKDERQTQKTAPKTKPAPTA